MGRPWPTRVTENEGSFSVAPWTGARVWTVGWLEEGSAAVSRPAVRKRLERVTLTFMTALLSEQRRAIAASSLTE
jgi:hypothetical protein